MAERLEGDATNDFGAPGAVPASDRGPVDEAAGRRLAAILRACWRKFDRAAQAAVGAVLSKGPRGGGRELDMIVRHVLEADASYLYQLGDRARKVGVDHAKAEMTDVRKRFLGLFTSRAQGDPAPRIPRSGTLWMPRYSVRRSAWHALDHAWEIEDRASAPSRG